MSEWIKRSEREPTEADFKVGVRFGGYPFGAGWTVTGRLGNAKLNVHREWTMWQLDPIPERPKRREFWANLKTGCFYSLKASGSGDLIRLVEFSPDEPVPPL